MIVDAPSLLSARMVALQVAQRQQADGLVSNANLTGRAEELEGWLLRGPQPPPVDVDYLASVNGALARLVDAAEQMAPTLGDLPDYLRAAIEHARRVLEED